MNEWRWKTYTSVLMVTGRPFSPTSAHGRKTRSDLELTRRLLACSRSDLIFPNCLVFPFPNPAALPRPAYACTSVPIGSPSSTRLRLPYTSMLNT